MIRVIEMGILFDIDDIMIAVEDNNLEATVNSLNKYQHDHPIFNSVLTKAIKLNNKDKLDLAILEVLIRSNKFDVSAKHFQKAKTEGAKKAFQTYLSA